MTQMNSAIPPNRQLTAAAVAAESHGAAVAAESHGEASWRRRRRSRIARSRRDADEFRDSAKSPTHRRRRRRRIARSRRRRRIARRGVLAPPPSPPNRTEPS